MCFSVCSPLAFSPLWVTLSCKVFSHSGYHFLTVGTILTKQRISLEKNVNKEFSIQSNFYKGNSLFFQNGTHHEKIVLTVRKHLICEKISRSRKHTQRQRQNLSLFSTSLNKHRLKRLLLHHHGSFFATWTRHSTKDCRTVFFFVLESKVFLYSPIDRGRPSKV